MNRQETPMEEKEQQVLVRDSDGNVDHDASYWHWKYLRREEECEELADRLRATEAALEPFAALAAEVDRLRHSDDSTCPHRLSAGDIRAARTALNNYRATMEGDEGK